MDFNEFAESIKAKHPQYKEIDNLKLAKAMVTKYPQYSEKVNFETEQPKKEYTPKPVEYNLDDTAELTQSISQTEGIPYQEAQERVANFPNRSKAIAKGDEYPIVSTVADVAGFIPRFASGLSALAGGEDPYLRMAQTKSKPSTGIMGGFGEFAENIFLDPLTYIGGGIGNAITKGITSLAPSMGNVAKGAIGGLTTSSAEFGLEQAKRMEIGEELQGLDDYAMQAGGGSVLGAGAGKIGDVIQGRKEIAEAPSVLKKVNEVESAKADDLIEIDYSGNGADVVREAGLSDVIAKNPKLHRERMTKDVMDATGFSKKQAESIPPYARGVFANIDEEGKAQINKYITTADTHLNDGMSVTPFDEAGKLFVNGEKAIGEARMSAGAKMGEIEKQYLSGADGVTAGAIDVGPYKQQWADLMAEFGGMVRKVDDDGKVSYESTLNKKMVPSNDRIDFKEIDEEINELGDYVTGEYLRSLENNLSQIMRSGKGTSTRHGKMNTKADVATNKMVTMGRELVGDQIEANGGKEARDLYNASRKDYAKYWTAQDFIQRRLGKGIADESGETATRGASMISAMLNSNQDRNTKTLARMINDLTGEDIGKHAVMAKFAMQTAGDKKGGAKSKALKSKGEYVSNAIDWGLNKITHKGSIPRDFEGMTSMVQKAKPQRARSFLDLIQDNPVAKYGAQGLQNFGQPALRSGIRGLGGNDEQ